jgi:general secretion pathway protein G
MNTKLLVLSVVVVLTTTITGVSAGEEDEAARWDTLLDLLIIDQVLQTYFEQNVDDPRPEEWESLGSFARDLPSPYKSRLPRRDGWGSTFRIGAIGDRLVVISAGPNRTVDAMDTLEELSSDSSYSGPLPSRLEGDDIVLYVGGEIANRPLTLRQSQKRTMADARTIGTAIESYSIDNNVYPWQARGLLEVAAVETELAPVYVRTLPHSDAWGNPFLYWSDGTSYLVVSSGADGLLDRSYLVDAGGIDESAFTGEFDDPNNDIVFANGQFTQWPKLSWR